MRQHAVVRRVVRWGARLTAGALGVVLLAGAAVYGASERHATRRHVVAPHALIVRTDSATVARGAHLAQARGCVGCHGEGLVGRVELDEPMIGRLAGPNLTTGGRGAELSDADWERAVRHGVRRDGTPLFIMPAQEHNGMSDEDLGAIVAYARRAAPSANVAPPSFAGPVMRTLQTAGKAQLYPAEQIAHARPHPARAVRRRCAPAVTASASRAGRSRARRPTGSRRRTSRRRGSGTTPRPTSCARCATACAPAARASIRACPSSASRAT